MSPLTNVHSKWASGNLVFHEAGDLGVGADVLKIATDAVTVGSTTNDVDFKWYGTGSVSFILDVGDSSMTLVGCNVSVDGDIEISANDIALDQGYYIYFEGLASTTNIRADAVGYLALTAATGIDFVIGSTDEVAITSTAVTLATNNLTLTAGHISVAATKYIYLDGQSGTDYIRAVTDSNVIVNAATSVALGTGGTARATITSSAFTVGVAMVLSASMTNGITISGNCSGSAILLSGSNGVDITFQNGCTMDNRAAGLIEIIEDTIQLTCSTECVSRGDFRIQTTSHLNFNSTLSYIFSPSSGKLYLLGNNTADDAIWIDVATNGGIKLGGKALLPQGSKISWGTDHSSNWIYFSDAPAMMRIESSTSVELTANNGSIYLNPTGTVRIQTTSKLEFNNQNTYMYSPSGNKLMIHASSTANDALILSSSGHIRVDGQIRMMSYLTLMITDTDGSTRGQLWYDSSANKFKYYDGSAVQVIAIQ